MQTVCVAFKAHLAWANSVAVLEAEALAGKIEPVAVQRIELVDAEERQLAEPYHVAGGWHGLEQSPRPANPEEIIERARAAQYAGAETALAALRETLRTLGYQWRLGVICQRRGIVHDLESTLSSHAHIHIAEADAVRAALSHGLSSIGIEQVGQDEKSVATRMGDRLGLTAREIDGRLKSQRPTGVTSWRAEERMLAMAATLADSG